MTSSAAIDRKTRWIRLARAAWYVLFGIAVGILLASIPGFVALSQTGLHSGELVVEPTPITSAITALTQLASFGVAATSLALAWLLFRRGSADPMALFVSFFLLFHGASTAGPIEALEPFIVGAADFNIYILQPIIFIPMTMALFAIFPDGRFVPPWTRWMVFLAILLTPVSVVASPLFLGSGSTGQAGTLLAVTYLVLFFVAVLMLYAQIYRYRRVSTPLQSQQTKWVILGIGVWFVLVAASTGPWMILQSLPPGSPLPDWAPIVTLMWVAATAVLPVSLALSILRFRLYEVDLILNRTVVYATLTALIAGLYLLAVVAFGALFQSNLVVAVLATAMAAILFQPLRLRLQRGVNRLMYGERDDPYAALARLGRRLEIAQDPEATLSTVVETIAQTLKLPYVAIASGRGENPRLVARYGLYSSALLTLPLVHQGQAIGELQVARRTDREDFSPSERRLLDDIARQVSVAAHSAQLTADLRRARQDLVTSREEERRRLRRDLHDGLGPVLAAMNLQVSAVRHLVETDPRQAEAVIADLKGEIRTTIDEVRRLVYDLRPPALDELGLAGAVGRSLDQASRAQADGTGPSFQLDSPADLPPLPAAVEVAAYRIVQEAVANVTRHARARRCTVSLRADGDLSVEILDDGVGLPSDRPSGVGLISMRERAEELGGRLDLTTSPAGGTRVRASLPLRP